MEVEKRNSKGGFFQLFDWNGKSRKKLFPDKQESPGKFLRPLYWVIYEEFPIILLL